MAKVYLGMKVNYLTVIDSKRIHKDNDYTQGYYLCKCECGNIKQIKSHSLTTGKIRDCGCGEFMRRKHIGKKYGNWEVIDAYRETRSDKINIVLKCKCIVCGKETLKVASNIKHCETQYCRHNEKKQQSKSIKLNVPNKLRICWRNMNKRCYEETDIQYPNYGGRGIKVCDEWHNSLKVFVDWALNSGYSDNLTIERIDVNGNYCPENCTWIPKEQQSRNTRKSRIFEWKGQFLTVAEIARMENISQYTLYCRLNKGISIKDSVLMSFPKQEE